MGKRRKTLKTNKKLSLTSFFLYIVFTAFAAQPVLSINQAFNDPAQSPSTSAQGQWERRQLLDG